MTDKVAIRELSQLLSPSGRKLLCAKGSDLVQEIGLEIVRDVVLDILAGHNLRDSTEPLTRRRIAALNLGMVSLFLKGSSLSGNFVTDLPEFAHKILLRKRVQKTERWLAQWMLGLTDKAFQNVLRDDPALLERYREEYIRTCEEVICAHVKEVGELRGELELSDNVKAQINWLWLTYLLNAIGSQTLAIRGSEKSTYGKLFEKLVLGSLLHILGFNHMRRVPQQVTLHGKKLTGVFWLSSKGERRQSDATLLYELGKGVRFDIGFIGRGNPEISLDKVTRFEHEISFGGSKYYMATIILVDRIGEKSSIEELAKRVGGEIIQMSASYWPKKVAQVLHQSLGFKHPILDMDEGQIQAFLRAQIARVPLEEFVAPSSEEG